ncbi:MAG TPA: SUMF1/EgtB/PvdO family nonheme iron enzyme [Noviherbaspirillum sp.]|uniref:formylglycine-generating enzyme family protein n=1 Tax=Noviherbaspirillum sp. TaxID=1926288 RepID=UPI002B499AFF|nr:SUMF1/EgtB/PvdO family nonheme iron enzyme [Noviherbaspirillum sp.]HJV86505.1 SUMF1/EgtB/PvdO family nonheme iron enzyme [Noviherbaspirillum sp.]
MPAPRDTAWHWPTFTKTLCGTMSDRERLGLPEHYVPDRFSESAASAYARMSRLDIDAPLQIVDDGCAPLVERIAAGNMLALLGDPRIDTRRPAMIVIEAAEASIGLDTAVLDSVVAEFADLGLDRQWLAKECPRHRVALGRYAIAKFPVTNQEYRDFLLDTQYAELPSSWTYRRYPQERSNHPVYTVSADAAEAYARWLAQKTGRAFRLPSEAEWEYAAAGPAGLTFPWGEHFDAGLANTAETGLFTTSPVGVFVGGHSPFGVADMAGNVEEYVTDNYAAYPGGELIHDHLTPANGAYRVARGGSFARFRDLARTRRRHGHNPASATYTMGFRLAENY